MRFGPVPLAEAEGARLGHSVRVGRRLPKGHVLTAADVEALGEAGHDPVVVARLDAGDVEENEAARLVAAALATPTMTADEPGTGRCNLHAAEAGLFAADRDIVDAVNRIDPGITLATLAHATPVEPGRMVATVKIIPFAVARAHVDEVCDLLVEARRASEPVTVHPFRPMRVAMVSTLLPTLKASVIDKTERIMRERLVPLGSELVSHVRVPHETQALAGALRDVGDADLVTIFGASAVADADDVIPAAIRAAGGRVETFGMPVDPGNLLCFGRLDGAAGAAGADGADVVGAPGCARAPAENGFDWVLHRLAAGLPVSDEWVRSLGVGGLLMEIHSRPSPRERPRESEPDLAVLVLAAGRSRRMGEINKLTRPLDGLPLVAHAVDAALSADIGPVHVVTGHEAELVEAALAGRDLRFVRNPDFAEGMSTSLRAGVEAAGGAGGLLVMLGDMPDVSAEALRRLVRTFREHRGERVVAAEDAATGRRGNPVVWPRAMFDDLRAIHGDKGARDLLKASDAVTVPVEGAALDLDTPEAFAEREGA